MNYFASCLYGDCKKLEKIIDDISLKANDTLWLIGDVIDGDDEHPENNLKLLDILMNNNNIQLILGDHEYAQNLRYLSKSSEEDLESWISYSNQLLVSGKSFNDYIINEMNNELQDEYFGNYLLTRELSEVVPIGDRYFYLIHGTPNVYTESNLTNWQFLACTEKPNIERFIWNQICTDPMTNQYLRLRKPMKESNTIVICGQLSPQDASDMIGVKDNNASIFYYNKYLAIGRNYPDEPVPVVGIDAAGFFIKGVY